MNVVVGVVKSDLGFLFLQRTNGDWTFPSGKVEIDETEVSAVEREILEETGVKATAVEFLGERKRDEVELKYYFCIATQEQEAVNREPEKFSSVGWLPSQDIIKKAENLFDPIRQKLEQHI